MAVREIAVPAPSGKFRVVSNLSKTIFDIIGVTPPPKIAGVAKLATAQAKQTEKFALSPGRLMGNVTLMKVLTGDAPKVLDASSIAGSMFLIGPIIMKIDSIVRYWERPRSIAISRYMNVNVGKPRRVKMMFNVPSFERMSTQE